MRKSNKKRSMILMAGVLAASIVVGNARWMATADEIDNSTTTVTNGEEAPGSKTAGSEAAEVEETAADQAGGNQSNTGDTGSEPGGTGSQTESETGGSEGQSENQTDDEQDGSEDQSEDEQDGSEDQTDKEQDESDDQTEDQTDKEQDGSKDQNDDEQSEDPTKENPGNTTIENPEPQGSKTADPSIGVKSGYYYPAVESYSQWTGDSIPGWANSNQEFINGNLGVAEQYRLLEQELKDRVNRAMDTYGVTDKSVTYEENNFLDILAIYAVKHDMTEDFPYNVEFEDQEAREELIAIFNQMTRVNKLNSDNLMVVRLTYEDVIDEFELDDTQKTAVADLVTDEAETLLQEIYDTSILSQLNDEEFAAMESALTDDISGARRSVLLAALSLEGKVNYFWGGKSFHVGWDERWGQQGLVTAAGSTATGTVRSYGLDCSGFVSWAFINGGGDQSVIAYIGNGTSSQFNNCYEISWEEAQPGDLVFYRPPSAGSDNHVGIVLSNDETDGIKIIHCSSSNNGVVVTGKVGFQYIRRPYIYAESSETETES